MNKKLINVVKGDINTALENGNYNRNTTYQTNIEFNTPTKLILLDGIPYSSPLLTKVTWQELKNKRDAGELIPGSLYRITDYQCTTTQENTRSAGHQFDIVLLALSENKLAEEGWAMEHPTDVYDVTFKGNYHNPITVRKCYIYCIDIENNRYNIVDCETLLGISGTNGDGEDFIIDEINKTCDATLYGVDDLNEENLTYNYFQNSNLSAWKVWYCLDNDTARFAWADDSVDEGSPANIECTIFDWDAASNVERWYRNPSSDVDNKYYWIGEGSTIEIYTDSENPTVGASVYNNKYGEIGTVSLFNPSQEGTNLPNGRGVIYRMIDEWNNDVPYDFKNILYFRDVYFNYMLYGVDNYYSKDSVNDKIINGTTYYAYKLIYHQSGPPAPPSILYSTDDMNVITTSSILYTISSDTPSQYSSGTINDVNADAYIKYTFNMYNDPDDMSILAQKCYNNIITAELRDTNSGGRQLNKIILSTNTNSFIRNNIFEQNCTDIHISHVLSTVTPVNIEFNKMTCVLDILYNGESSMCYNTIYKLYNSNLTRLDLCFIKNAYDLEGAFTNVNLLDSGQVRGKNGRISSAHIEHSNLISVLGNSDDINIYNSRDISFEKEYMFHITIKDCNNLSLSSNNTTSPYNRLRNIKIEGFHNDSKLTINHSTVNDSFYTIYRPTGSTVVTL